MHRISRLRLSQILGPPVFPIRNVIRYSAFGSLSVPKARLKRAWNPAPLSFQRSKSDEMGDAEAAKTDLKTRLTPLQYHVTQEKGTERPFTGIYNKTTDAGLYSCIVCGEVLFSSDTKYDSGCGWPAFNDVLDKGLIKLSKDTSTGIVRTEVQCAKCDSHLGHVFNDGPLPTGKRFCINSASLDFKPANKE